MTPFFHRLRAAADGIAAVEFGLAAPVLLVLLMGIFDIGHLAYARAVLQGAVDRAARAGTIETASLAQADARLADAIRTVVPDAEVAVDRRSYLDFADVDRPEAWNDEDNDGACGNGEAYTDENRNGRWDADVGRAGNGGAEDVVLTTVTVRYRPLFPVPFLAGSEGLRTISASAVRKNQPFAQQAAYGTSAGTCA